MRPLTAVLLAALCLGLSLGGCTAPGFARSDAALRFATLDDVYGLLLYKNLVADLPENRRIAQKSSWSEAASLGGRDFLAIYMDYRGPGHQYGIRGQNGPIYILLKSGDGWLLVGEFLGSRLWLAESGGATEARVYYHWSAAGSEPDVYPFKDGRFNAVSAKARGDGVFK